MDDMKEGKIYTNPEQNITLRISEDGFSAYLTIKDTDGMIDEKEITKLLHTTGIKYGVEEAVEYNSQHGIQKESNVPFLVALGKNPEAQSEVSYLFNTENCFNHDEQYNIYELEKFEKVHKHQPLANLKLTDISQPGMDIFGNETPSGVSAQLNVDNYIGDNVYYSEEDNQILALKSGYPYVDYQNKIYIKADFFINEDIIDKTLKIFGDVTIDGVVTNSKVEVEGNLKVKGNISNCIDTGIYVNGDVNIEYSENSKIVSSGKIVINKSARFCSMHADKEIIGEENSSIAGGLIQSGKNIDVYTIGSPFSLLTEVEIASAPYLKEQIKKAQSELSSARNNPEENEEIIIELTSKLKELEERYEEVFNEHLSDELGDYQIKVNNKIYPGTHLRILKHSKIINEELDSATFSVINNKLDINEVDKFE